jgi:hypothetical protein
MSSKEQRRQKKLAKKRSKEIAKKREVAREKNYMKSFAGQMDLAIQGEILDCYLSNSLIDSEIKFGTAMIIRQMPQGRVACIRFLVDAMCQGVRDATESFVFKSEFRDTLEFYLDSEVFRVVNPSTARKFVEDAIEFGRDCGFEPTAKYAKRAPIWGDIDASECKTVFHFGDKDGKPVFISGPNERPEDVARIIETLEAKVGAGNYKVDIDNLYGIDEEGQWYDDPELDVDIDEDVVLDESIFDAPENDDLVSP